MFFRSRELIQKYSDSLPKSLDACGRKGGKKKLGRDAKISGHVWTVQTEYFFLTLGSLVLVLQLQSSVQYINKVSIWRENMLGYLSAGIICSENRHL